MRADIDLTADAFPSETVSNDGRNYPQYAPTTSYHRPDVNCFQSWMTDLNNLLSDRWHQPVFIANEGWGGITSDGYRRMMREDKGWQARMDLLRPSVWLIHLGVNDERAHVPAAEYAKNMGAIVDLLITRYGAAPDRILVCRPCYDYFEGAPEILQTYIAANDQLVAERGLRPGPDFFSAYSVDKDKWYGADPVHPNTEGMQYMAKLWAEAILSALPNGATR